MLLCKVGILKAAGNGRPIEPVLEISAEELESARSENNARVLGKVAGDNSASGLLRVCQEDAAMGRMTPARPVSHELQDEAGQHVSPRFGIEQEKVDGSVKLRAIDDFTFSWLNGHTAASEKLRCDGLDLLFEVMRLQMENGSKVC